MSKIKTFLTDSQPGYVLNMFYKILVNLSLNVLIKIVLIEKKSVCLSKYCMNKYSFPTVNQPACFYTES